MDQVLLALLVGVLIFVAILVIEELKK